jgi:aminopeptidase N
LQRLSADFKTEEDYGLTSYLKTAVWMYVMELNFGKEKLDAAMKAYFNQWKFKHPYPEDMKAVFEKELKADVAPYFDLLKKKGSL